MFTKLTNTIGFHNGGPKNAKYLVNSSNGIPDENSQKLETKIPHSTSYMKLV
jgi:hypothetical protein